MFEYLPRWVKASVSTHFKKGLDAQDVYMHMERAGRITAGLTHWVEFRMDGPYTTKVSSGLWSHFFEVNTMIMDKLDEKNMYRIEDLKGLCLSLFVEIPIFRLGEGAFDDGSYIGCLKPYFGKRDKIKVSDFGTVEDDLHIGMAQVEGHYTLETGDLILDKETLEDKIKIGGY